MDDIRYSELLFLRGVAANEIQLCNYDSLGTYKLGVNSSVIAFEMALAALEDLHVQIDNSNLRYLVFRLRGELP